MIHIDTKSIEEIEARKKYANAKDGIAIASDELAAKVAELLALRHKMDEDELRKSKMMAEIMDGIKEATILKDKSGKVIVTWKKASMKAKINYKGLLKKLKATDADIKAFSKIETGARTFELVEDQAECAELLAETLAEMDAAKNESTKQSNQGKPEEK